MMERTESTSHRGVPVAGEDAHVRGRMKRGTAVNYPGNQLPKVTSAPAGHAWDATFWWLEHFWDVVVRKLPERIWRICGLTDLETSYDLRDGLACVMVHRRLDQRNDVEEHYYQAWGTEKPDRPHARDYLVIGRPHLYFGSELVRFLQPLAGHAHVRFEECPGGRTAVALRYGERRFVQAEIEEGGRHIRRDYGVLMFRHHREAGEDVRLISIAGLSALATLALTHVLTDADELDRLVEQVRALVPADSPVRFDRAFEICIRIDVDKAKLPNFANELDFAFEVEVVTGGEEPPSFRTGPVELMLHPYRNRAGGEVRGGNRVAKLSAHRYELMAGLIDNPAGRPTEDLLDDFYLRQRGLSARGGPGRRPDAKQMRSAYGALRKLVYDTNDMLEKISPKWRPIVQSEGRYVLRARGRIDEKP